MNGEKTQEFPANEALAAFAPFVGEWSTSGTHGMIPNTVLHGHTSFSWHESGAFLIMRSDITEDVGIPKGIALIGSDDILNAYMMLYYDERGVSRHYQVTIKDGTIAWWRNAPDLSQRYTLTLSDDKQTVIGKGEISKDGDAWEQDLNLTYTRH